VSPTEPVEPSGATEFSRTARENAVRNDAAREDDARESVLAPMAPRPDRFRARRLLVTGGAGFIGAVLARRAVACGWRVRVLDDRSGASVTNARADGVEHRVGSVTDREAVVAALDGCDAVVHLAARVGVRRVLEAPAETLWVNAVGTRIVALEAARRGVRLLNASSSEVLGVGRAARPMREDDPPLTGAGRSPRWSYAISKLAGERLVADLARADGLRAVTVRFFNTTGPDQSPASGMVLPRMFADALELGRVRVHGDGRQVRSFCCVDDVVEALLALLASEECLWDGRVFHVGNDEATTIAALAERVAAHTGAQLERVPYARAFGPGFEDVRVRVPDLTRLVRAVGWRPRVDLASLVERCAAAANARRTLAATRG